MRRALAACAAVLLVAAALAGCVRNLPVAGVDWLSGRDGIAEAEVLADNTGPWSSSGLIRGELEPGISDEKLARLVDEVRDYRSETGSVAIWLGYARLDFAVDADDTRNERAIDTWRTLLGIDGIANGVVFADELSVRSLRTDAPSVWEALAPLETELHLEAFADAQALEADRLRDLEYDQPNPAAIEYIRGAGCQVRDAVLGFVGELLTRPGVSGATADLCAGITIDLPAGESVATQAGELRSRIDDAGLSDFPVQLTSEIDGPGTVHFAAISPGDATLLPILRVFERAGAPVVSYSLGADGQLAVTAYRVPTRELLTLVQSEPTASRLSGIGLEGDPVAIIGQLDQLPRLLDEAVALEDASDAFGDVQLGQGFGLVHLQAEGAGTPDVQKAADDLRATGVTDRRFFSVRYAAFQADIVNGVAALSDPGYVGADVMIAFVDAWNASAPGG